MVQVIRDSAVNRLVVTSGGGTVTDVTASPPLSSSGGTTPDISIMQSSGSMDGYLSATDWTAFNGKQSEINGTGFVKASGTSISYDNSTYLTTSTAASTYVPYTGATGNVNLGVHSLISHSIIGDASDGIILEANNGTDIGILGAANTANVSWYGAHNYSVATQDTIAAFTGAGKTLGSLSTTTYPSLTELSYVKGVTSAIQTQINAKQASDATLTALAAYNTNGILTQTAADTFTGRTITGTSNQVSVSNGDGVSGNPTLSLPQDIATSSSPQFSNIGIGGAASSTSSIFTQGNTLTGTTQYAFRTQTTANESATTAFYGQATQVRTKATSFTCALGAGVKVLDGSVGAGSTLTTQVGIDIDALTVGGTNNYGIRSVVASSATGGYNLYISGTAPNYFNGAVAVGNSGTALGKVESRATSGSQFTASYDASNYGTWTVGSTGINTFNAVGSSSSFVFSDSVQAPSMGVNTAPSSSSVLVADLGGVAGTSTIQNCIQAGGTVTGTNSYDSIGRGVQGFYGVFTVNNATNATGFYCFPQLANAAVSVTNMNGIQTYTGYGYNSGASVTTARGVYIKSWGLVLPGTFTNQRGIHIENITGATNNYAIYSEGGQSYHAGKFGINAGTPTSMLHAISSSSSTITGIFRGAASQSANLTEWHNSSGTTLSSITSNGGFSPASMADSSAANNTIYYSTTAGKLVYKDAGGTVNNLY